jgi:hypothetical protein
MQSGRAYANDLLAFTRWLGDDVRARKSLQPNEYTAV